MASHQRHRDDFAYQRRVALLAESQRSIISTRYNKALSRAFLARARSANNAPSQTREETKSAEVSGRRVGWVQESSLGTKVLHMCGLVIAMPLSKAAGNHFRHAEVEEQLPWHDLYDSLRDTEEHTHFDLCPPAASRHPQWCSNDTKACGR